MNKIHEWINTILIVIVLISLGLVGGNQRVPQETSLGAGTRYPNGLSTDSTAPSSGEVRTTTLTVTGDSAITGESTQTGELTLDGGLLYSSTFATTSQGTVTYTAGSITGIHTVLHETEGATTGTLPASTTLATFLPTAGDRRSIVWVNEGSGTLTMAGGTGTLLKTASSTKAVLSGGSATLEFVRKTDTDIVVNMVTGI